jgi:hypothetical protein
MCLGGGPLGRRGKTTAMNDLSPDRYSPEAIKEANTAYQNRYDELDRSTAPIVQPINPTDGGIGRRPIGTEEAMKAYEQQMVKYEEQVAARQKSVTDGARAAGVEAADLYLNKWGPRQGQTRIQYQGQATPGTAAGSNGGAMAGGTMLTGGTLSTGAKTAKKPTLLGQ